jgi:ABC-type transport system involved in multi-copper enzyme maturation permease subunit
VTAAAAGMRAGFAPRRNPIFNRELVTLLRSRKAFLLLGVYLSISIAIVLLSWPRGSATLLLQGAVSREVFSIFGLGQTLLLALLIPATLGACMTTEKEGETLDLLLTTPVAADEIVLGKLASGLFYFMLLELSSVPVLLLCFVIGGLAMEDVLGLYGHLLSQLVLYGLTSVTCSIYFHRTHIAVILSYVFVGMEAVGLQALYGNGLSYVSGGGWIVTALLGLPAAGLLYAAARYGITRPYNPVRKTIEEEDADRTVGLVLRRDHFPDKLIVPPRRRGPLDDGANPVLDKELQAEILGSGSLFIRLVIQLGLTLSMVTFFWVLSGTGHLRDTGDGHSEWPYFCFIIGYIMILAPSIAATTFTHEKEEHTIESLLLTLIPRSRIILGKFLAIGRVVAALSLLNSCGFVIIVMFSSFNVPELLALGITLVTVTAFTTALGMGLSLYCRTTLAATISTYFLLFALFIGPVLAQTFLTRLFPNLALRSFDFLRYVSPFLASHRTGGGEFHLLVTLLIHGFIYVTATAFLLGIMMWRFEKVIGRQAQKL